MNGITDSFYEKHLGDFGPSAKGVGWKDSEAQTVRFHQLAKLLPPAEDEQFSVNDLGCGVGDLVSYLDAKYRRYSYSGYDILDKMIALATAKFPPSDRIVFRRINHANEMAVSDYTMASGIFNIRFTITDEEWLTYILDTLSAMNQSSLKGFSFNMLTKYSDAELMRKELYYADPCYIFDYCKRNFSKNVALLHDYNFYDFTVIIRK